MWRNDTTVSFIYHTVVGIKGYGSFTFFILLRKKKYEGSKWMNSKSDQDKTRIGLG